MKNIIIYLIGVGSAIFIDYLWVGLLMRKFYQNALGSLVRIVDGSIKVNVPSFILVYVVFVLALMVFALPRAGNFLQAFGQGALLGFFIYAVYDLTNYATLAGWSLKLMVVDVAWGTLLSGIITLILFWLKNIL